MTNTDIEKELGRGGMGAVYLSTHIGTERPVAVKVIVPEFMRRSRFYLPEFEFAADCLTD